MTDNRENLNDAEVNFLLAGDVDDTPNTALSHKDGNQSATMHGDLDQISLADIFQTLSISKMEGVLRIRNPLEERQILCYQGYVRILAPERLTFRRLGQRLIQAGILQPEDLRKALVAQKHEKISLGQILVRDERITQDALDEILDMQVAEDLFGLFTWRRGTFEFFKSEPADHNHSEQFEQCPEYEINSLLLEVARRSDEWESILDNVISLDEVPIQISEPTASDQLDDNHITVLQSIDGRSTYRQLAENTTLGLFTFSRAARDLVSGDILAHIDDLALAGIAEEAANIGERKQAKVLLQTLRDREGDRSLDVTLSMAQIMQAAGERRLASELLLDVAERSPTAKEATELARKARELAPYDHRNLTFLRKVLAAHSAPDSAELEKCTIDLLDALLDNNLISEALEIIDEAHRNDAMQPQILMREARARQKSKDIDGAVNALTLLADSYIANGNRTKATEAYEAILRLDRSRKEIQRTLTGLRRTRIGSIIRIAASISVIGLISSMGFVWWQQDSFETSVSMATNEVQTLLDNGNRTAAQTKLTEWHGVLGDCDTIQDLSSRVTFANATEKNRLAKLQRLRINNQFTKAAAALGQGKLRDALAIYCSIYDERGRQTEVIEVVENRISALVNELTRSSMLLSNHQQPDSNQLFDRKQVTTDLTALQEACPPSLIRSFDELSELSSDSQLPEFVQDKVKAEVAAAITNSRSDIEEYRKLIQACQQALQRNDTERRLDPMFKAAVAKEAQYDFQGALQLYLELAAQPTGDVELRRHFRDRIERNRTILRLKKALSEATQKGDYEAAMQSLHTLRESYPAEPFDSLVRLPLLIESQPSNGVIYVNGIEVGTAPLLLSRIPGDKTAISVKHDGFRSANYEAEGDGEATWTACLTLIPDAIWHHNSPIDCAPIRADDQHQVFVDRSGKVHKLTQTLETTVWTFASKDLSGWLTAPVRDHSQILVGSLDGKLRALNAGTGELQWSLDGLPSDVDATVIDRSLVMATTDRRLHTINLDNRQQKSVTMRQAAIGALIPNGDNVVVIGEGGLISCWSVAAMKLVWQKQLDNVASPQATSNKDLLIVNDDQGQLFGLDLKSGQLSWQRDLKAALVGSIHLDHGVALAVAPDFLHRISVDTGEDLNGFQAKESRWAGSATMVANRMIVPLESGSLQVIASKTGEALYLIAGDSKSRVFACGENLTVINSDHSVRTYNSPR